MKGAIFLITSLSGQSGLNDNKYKIMTRTAFIVLTCKCNRNCLYCFYKQEKGRKRNDKITIKNIGRIIKDLKFNNFNELCFTGGEPLTRKKLLFKAVTEAKKLDFAINLDTNGTLLDTKTIKNLAANGLSKIFLSSQYINYLSEDILKFLINTIPITLIHVATKENLNNLQNIIKKAEQLKLDLIIQFAYISIRNKYFNKLSLLKLTKNQKMYFANNLKYWANKNHKENYSNLIFSYYKKKEANYPKSCHMGSNDIVIDSNGDVYPCFHRQDLLAGNILQNPLKNMILKMESFSKQTQNASCFGEHCISLFYN